MCGLVVGHDATNQAGANEPAADDTRHADTRWLRTETLLAICGIVLGGAVVAGAIAMAFDLRQRAIASASRELKTTAWILADRTDRAFQAIGLVQDDLIDRLRALEINTPEDYERRMSGHDIHRMLKEKAGSRPHLGAITLINAQGKLFNFSRFWPLPTIDVTDREFFRALKADPQLTSFMGEPVKNRATGSWTIHLARKVVGPSGEFMGLILGAMEME
jgi:hypothetical protein